MQARIQKWGNSLGLRIPKQFAKLLQWHSGSSVSIEIENGRVVIESPKLNLETMLEAINEQNVHHLMLEDKKLGSEEW